MFSGGSQLVLWAPVLPQEVGVVRDEGGQSNEKP